MTMKCKRVGAIRSWAVIVVLFALPAMTAAQEAAITGVVTDTTGAVLPGVTVTAVHEASGNTFLAVTDAGGAFRIAARVGAYRIAADLPGFATVTRTGVTLLVGQNARLDLQMSVTGLAESVTVTAEAPLISTTQSSMGGNVDPRQMQELPVSGRNWMQLALLAPGSRTNSVNAATPLPDRNDGEVREFQLNVDGQQVSTDIGTGSQARFSQDSIAEFEFLSNRFDATQGRSSGVQVNAITKSGSNRLSGLLRGNFRDDAFNARNPVLQRVEPITNQQFSTAVGGPVVIDKLHYFGNYEYEREPRTSIWNTPYPAFNVELTGTNTRKMGLLRMDYQISPQLRIMGKGSGGRRYDPFTRGDTSHPAATNFTIERNNEGVGQLTQVLSNALVNEIKIGYAYFIIDQGNLTRWSNHWQKANGIGTGSPRISFTGFNVSGNRFMPRYQNQRVWSVRDDFTFSYDAAGRHDVRSGAEFLDRRQIQANCRQCMGIIDARGGPRPSNLEALFPDPFNADTWNLAALSAITRSYSIGVGNFIVPVPSKKIGAWLQDDWKVSNRLTLNLGLRYDLGLSLFANDITFEPWQQAGRPNDTNNFQPRIGFAYQLNDRTVIRGGSGLYFGDALGNDQAQAIGNVQIAVIRYTNDGRADFAANPTAGQPLPTYEQAILRFCDVNNNAPGCLIRDAGEVTGPPEFVHLPRTWQNSIGVQRQVGDTMAFQADYVYNRGRGERDIIDNVNLTFDPATGANYPFSDRARRAFPNWGVVSMNVHTGRSAYHALQTAWTKRFANSWQASATYTLSGLWNAESRPFSGLQMVPFRTAPDLGGEWSFSADDQRHRFVFNGIWAVGRGFQLSGLHFFAAGIRAQNTYGGDLRQTGGTFSQRLRPDGTIVPRNSLITPPMNRTDLRMQQRIALGRRFSVDAIAEVFNVFNRPNWGIGAEESSATYLRRITAEYRSTQFGFRLTF